MRTIRIYTPQPLHNGGQIILEHRASQHLTQVLRLRSGAVITLFNGDGTDYQAVIAQTERNSCRLNITQSEKFEEDSPLEIHLALGISKGERMEIAIQKSVELGVTRIIPLITERTNVRIDDQRQEKKHHHWANIIVSASEQSYRNHIATLEHPQHLENWIDNRFPGSPLRLVLNPTSKQTLATLTSPASKQAVWLLVGPEGGLTSKELQLAAKHGFTSIRLGPRILRTETAPLAAIAAMQALWGDFR